MKVKVERQRNPHSRRGDGIYNVEIKDLPWSLLQALTRACDDRELLADLAKELDAEATRADT